MKKSVVSLTFDDGYTSQITNGLPILNEFHYKGTFYFITKYLPHSDNETFMNNECIISLYRSGHEIGAHTVTHPQLQLQFWKRPEIMQSKKDLERLIDDEVKTFAYPYGRYNRRIVKKVHKAGYTSARGLNTTQNGYNLPGTDKYEISGKAVRWDTTLREVESWIEKAKRNNFWLVLVFHQIDEHHSKWGCSPEKFREICQWLSMYESEVLTVSQACKYLD